MKTRRRIQKVPLCPTLIKNPSYVCSTVYPKHENQQHLHGMKHHNEMQKVLGCRYVVHACQACNTKVMDLGKYIRHISTVQHKENVESLEYGDEPELVLSVHPAPPQTSESVALVSVSSQTVQHGLKPM